MTANQRFRIAVLVAGLGSVGSAQTPNRVAGELGACCFAVGTEDEGCVDGVVEAVCGDDEPEPFFWVLGGDCDIGCLFDPSSPSPEPNGFNKSRFISFIVSNGLPVPGSNTGLRVELGLLNHPRACCASQDENGFGVDCAL